MLSEFDEKRVAEGLAFAIDNSPEYIPNPAKIRQFIPRLNKTRQTCPNCVDMGGFVEAGLDKHGNRSVQVCNHGN